MDVGLSPWAELSWGAASEGLPHPTPPGGTRSPPFTCRNGLPVSRTGLNPGPRLTGVNSEITSKGQYGSLAYLLNCFP